MNDTRAPDQQGLLQRLMAKDVSLWTDDAETQEKVRNRLGWLALHETTPARLEEIESFVAESRERNYKSVVLLGMGGSSLAPEVFQKTFGNASGHPPLTVLDTTDPASIVALERSIDPSRTLFIVSSKSGTTIETDSLFRYFAAKLRAPQQPLSNFIAITDPGTPLETLARDEGFARCFLAPADVGGRYSALTFFGLVPAALIGVDVRRLLERARRLDMRAGVGLGATLGELSPAGRDKVTFLPSPGLPGFGAWAEQLLAESTGKEGKEIIPVDGEPAGPPRVYGDDRVFVRQRVRGRPDGLDGTVAELEAAGHPVISIDLESEYDLGAEFLRWETATAIAGALLRINPFDEPNVQEAKDITAQILRDGFGDEERVLSAEEGAARYAELLSAARPGDYAALLAFIPRSPQHDTLLTRMRAVVRYATRLATTAGYGPRYLHSTGQLHKGGPDKGIFLQLTVDDPEELPIPGRPYGFSTLKRAQALGDYRALQSRGRRIVRAHLGADASRGLERLAAALEGALSGTAAGRAG